MNGVDLAIFVVDCGLVPVFVEVSHVDRFWEDVSYGVDVGGVSVGCYDEGGLWG